MLFLVAGRFETTVGNFRGPDSALSTTEDWAIMLGPRTVSGVESGLNSWARGSARLDGLRYSFLAYGLDCCSSFGGSQGELTGTAAGLFNDGLVAWRGPDETPLCLCNSRHCLRSQIIFPKII